MNLTFSKPYAQMFGLVLLIGIASCSKDDDTSADSPAGLVPVVKTFEPSGISQYGSFAGGEVEDDNGSTVRARGVCWSTSIDPTINDSLSQDGSGAGEFKSLMRGLLPDTTYYVRAYATNARGTGYGNTYSIQTLAEIMVEDLDGNEYKGLTINGKTWFTENLRTTTLQYPLGSSITLITNADNWIDASTPAYCYYDNIPANKEKYGLLYNRAAVYGTFYTICPQGWHTASANDWNDLIAYAGGIFQAGGALKAVGFEFWNQPNSGATDVYGFSALGTGFRSGIDGQFFDLGHFAFWWSGFGESAVYMQSSNAESQTLISPLASDGLCVRCVMNQ